MTLLRIEGICKRYGSVSALEDVSLTVAAGTRTAIVGPSGSGKTSLLRVIAGFETPERGRILLDGQVLADGPMTVPAHRRAVGFVFQDGALFPHLSVADNIGFGLSIDGEERRERIASLMRMVDLGPHLTTRKPHQLSGGQQQRVALARALALKPRLMLLDEPFSALDTGLRAATRKAVEHLLAAAGIATILVTHDESEALSFADQIAIMREGRLAQTGSPDDIYWHPRDRGIAELLGEALILPAEISGGVARCILGAVPVAGDAAPGLGTIMLRHEQVSLLPEAAGGQGRIVELEFGGFASTAVVSIEGAACPAGTEQIMQFRCTNTTHLEVGNGVSFAVTGSAHVLA